MHAVPDVQPTGGVVERHCREPGALSQLDERPVPLLGVGLLRQLRELLRRRVTGLEQTVELALDQAGDLGLTPRPIALEVAREAVDAQVRGEPHPDRQQQEQQREPPRALAPRAGERRADQRRGGADQPPRARAADPHGDQDEAEPGQEPERDACRRPGAIAGTVGIRRR
jgi:hypothetical protein